MLLLIMLEKKSKFRLRRKIKQNQYDKPTIHPEHITHKIKGSPLYLILKQLKDKLAI